jgi:hypothetical protein
MTQSRAFNPLALDLVNYDLELIDVERAYNRSLCRISEAYHSPRRARIK